MPRASALLLPVFLLAAFSLTGCVRLHAAMALSQDDRVSGEIVAATPLTDDNDTGPQLKVPNELAGRVTTKLYRADNYTGTQLFFTGLTFEEVRALSIATSASSSRYQLGFRRSGDLVTMSGSVDLTQVPIDRADIQVKISFPGEIVDTNGREEEPTTIAWSPKPGQASMLTATIRYAGENSPSYFAWTMLVAGLTGGAALIVLVLAIVAHRRSLVA
ncbi:LppM family (lipo)protein [Actinosynnema sp. CS-041913]|uniref:LppM family (lipo)protein n=1 Tax=Actinosynnema sp. CS-041913 TaxID=3239917 RepID=UPI003D949419